MLHFEGDGLASENLDEDLHAQPPLRRSTKCFILDVFSGAATPRNMGTCLLTDQWNKMLAGHMRLPLWLLSRLVLIPKPLDPPSSAAPWSPTSPAQSAGGILSSYRTCRCPSGKSRSGRRDGAVSARSGHSQRLSNWCKKLKGSSVLLTRDERWRPST